MYKLYQNKYFNNLLLNMVQKKYIADNTIDTEEDLKKVYEMALTYGHNKNKYGQYDFNNYNKVITTIFNIK